MNYSNPARKYLIIILLTILTFGAIAQQQSVIKPGEVWPDKKATTSRPMAVASLRSENLVLVWRRKSKKASTPTIAM